MHVLQREPHLILLDPTFYLLHIKPIMAKWMLLWLCRAFSSAPSVPVTLLLKYLLADQQQIEECRCPVVLWCRVQCGFWPPS